MTSFDKYSGAEVLQRATGKTIASAALKSDDTLLLVFTDSTAITFRDRGQDCCEYRYMRTDEDLAAFAGAVLVDAEVADAPSVPAGSEAHDVQFLRIKTDRGTLVMSSHNEHNGYYGGFSVSVSDVETGASA